MSLHLEIVSEPLIELLRHLMQVDRLKSFYLVGGTALALRYGHRVSVDLDLFTHESFDSQQLAKLLVDEFDLTESVVEKNTVLGLIHGIKTDFIAHRYALVNGIEEIDGLRLLSVEDIAAMKLNAIANRGSKKDFWDLYELLQHFGREELLQFYEQKYPADSIWNVEKSLVYFDDAEADPDPVDLKGRSWAEVKTGIQQRNRL